MLQSLSGDPDSHEVLPTSAYWNLNLNWVYTVEVLDFKSNNWARIILQMYHQLIFTVNCHDK